MKKLYNASIRVVKSLVNDGGDWGFGTLEVVKEKMIEAKDKAEVKQLLLSKYPQFFNNKKVYQKETKDSAQFFYVITNELNMWELKQIKEGSWTCSNCGEVHENRYISRPKYTRKPPFQDLLFCNNDSCIDEYKKDYFKNQEMPDDYNHVRSDSLNYIYKCTEKSTGKSYIGKTRNAPFFRWWNHLTHSKSPFGIYLRSTNLSDWSFEVLEELPGDLKDNEVLEIESKYIVKYNSLHDGFNSVISNKKALNNNSSKNQTDLLTMIEEVENEKI